ncbi:MAG: NAD(+)/NADH kinase [Verrucomicrobiae bacterium]|nr:NAD(+)/NADH kinase [Verrucomicrobiae bacterium]
MRQEIRSLALVVNGRHPEAGRARERLAHHVAGLGVPMECLGPEDPERLADVASRAEGIVVAGGDGTLLAAVPAAAIAGRPLLGINMGSLGFLTPVVLAEAEEAVTAFVRGDWVAAQRSLLRAESSGGGGRADLGLALNEVTVGRRGVSRLVRFRVWVDDELVTSYSADGLVIATPTGSTAYSLSSHGPVLTPDAPVIGLTPICPHTLSNRPLVVSDRSRIRLRPEPGQDLVVSVDGRREEALSGDGELCVALAPERLTLALPRGFGFFELLRNKLNWRGSNL